MNKTYLNSDEVFLKFTVRAYLGAALVNEARTMGYWHNGSFYVLAAVSCQSSRYSLVSVLRNDLASLQGWNTTHHEALTIHSVYKNTPWAPGKGIVWRDCVEIIHKQSHTHADNNLLYTFSNICLLICLLVSFWDVKVKFIMHWWLSADFIKHV